MPKVPMLTVRAKVINSGVAGRQLNMPTLDGWFQSTFAER